MMAKTSVHEAELQGAVASVRPSRARGSSLGSSGSEEAVEGGSNRIEGEGGRDRRKARREGGRILRMPDDVYLSRGESGTEEGVGPEDT